MDEILKIGKLFKIDESGFIVNDAALHKITSPWKEVVEDIKKVYLDNLKEATHSIYVRGSVARGEAIKNISDVDTFAVIRKNPAEIDKSFFRQARKDLAQKYPFITGVEFGFINYDELFIGDRFFIDRFTIKTQSVCVYGQDLALQIPSFSPDFKTASHFSRNLKQVFENAKKHLSENKDLETINYWCRFVCKRIVRAGFILVMDKEKVFTRDLYPSYEIFSKYFPHQEPNMKRVLELAINPNGNSKEVIGLIDSFGAWVEKEIENKFAL
jgi:predicted nucleotidyltransferase